jgi:hypothetical protein
MFVHGRLPLLMALLASARGATAQDALAEVPLGPLPPCPPAPRVSPFRERPFEKAAFLVDQDAFVGRLNEDRNYTMGVLVQLAGAFVKPEQDQGLGRYAGWAGPLRAVDDLLGVDRVHAAVAARSPTWRESHTLTFGVTAFTPHDLMQAAPIRDDRPYASLAVLSVTRATTNYDESGTVPDHERVVVQSELTIGMLAPQVLGWGIAENVQTDIHRSMRRAGSTNPPDPMGWSHQISNGGEATARYRLGVTRLIGQSPMHDLALTAEGNVGYYTNAAMGAQMRVGLIGGDFSEFNSNPSSLGNEMPMSPRRQRRWPFQLYLFAAGRGRAVLYNALLQGQFRHSDVRLSWDEVSHTVMEFETGVAFVWRAVELRWTVLAGRTSEYEVGEHRTHTWGEAYVAFHL